MFNFFKQIADRVKAMFVTDAALDLEAQLAERAAERKAVLLRKAAAYDQDGMPEVAQGLRDAALRLDLSHPLQALAAPAENSQEAASEAKALPAPVAVDDKRQGRKKAG